MRRANWKRERAGRVVRTGMDAGKRGRHKVELVECGRAAAAHMFFYLPPPLLYLGSVIGTTINCF